MRKDKITENVNWSDLREKSGLTLAQLAAISGYSVATINGLELKNQGSDRLRGKLLSIFSDSVNRAAGIGPETAADPAGNAESEGKAKQSDALMEMNPGLEARVAGMEADLRLIKESVAALMSAFTRLLAESARHPDPPPPAVGQRPAQAVHAGRSERTAQKSGK